MAAILDERSALVNEIVERAERMARESAVAATPRRKGLPVGVQVACIVVFLMLIVVPPSALLPAQDTTTYAMLQGAHVQVWLVANEVERFRRNSGRLPLSLDEIQRAGQGVGYSRRDDGLYELTVGQAALRWRSDRPMAEILAGVPNSLIPSQRLGDIGQ